jgi:hypothetical protein
MPRRVLLCPTYDAAQTGAAPRESLRRGDRAARRQLSTTPVYWRSVAVPGGMRRDGDHVGPSSACRWATRGRVPLGRQVQSARWPFADQGASAGGKCWKAHWLRCRPSSRGPPWTAELGRERTVSGTPGVTAAMGAGCVKTPCRNGNQQFCCVVQGRCESSLPTPAALRCERARRTSATVFSHSLGGQRTFVRPRGGWRRPPGGTGSTPLQGIGVQAPWQRFWWSVRAPSA